VHIRRLAAEDEREFLARGKASRRLHRPWSYPPLTSASFRRLLDPLAAERSARLGVCLYGGGECVGYFGLGEITMGMFRNAYLGYYAFEPYAGHTYMREALELVLRYAFDDLRLHRLQAAIQPGNERSIALVRGAGFRKEGFAPRYLKVGGRWRDHELWAITSEERRRRPPA